MGDIVRKDSIDEGHLGKQWIFRITTRTTAYKLVFYRKHMEQNIKAILWVKFSLKVGSLSLCKFGGNFRRICSQVSLSQGKKNLREPCRALNLWHPGCPAYNFLKKLRFSTRLGAKVRFHGHWIEARLVVTLFCWKLCCVLGANCVTCINARQ